MKKKNPISETPKDKDQLEAYPSRKQVSAFPERRFIKMNRILVIFALINLACMFAGAGIFIYSAQRVSARVQNNQGLMLFQLDREEKVLNQAEYMQRSMPARQFITENFLRHYITERNALNDKTLYEAQNLLNDQSFVIRSSLKSMRESARKGLESLLNETIGQNKVRDVHIYNLHPYYGSLWTAVIETFDFPKQDSALPVCNCFNNTSECLKCKYENTLLRQRRRIWIRVIYSKNNEDKWVRDTAEKITKTSMDNPFGIVIIGYYVGYMPKDPQNLDWDLPSELRKN